MRKVACGRTNLYMMNGLILLMLSYTLLWVVTLRGARRGSLRRFVRSVRVEGWRFRVSLLVCAGVAVSENFLAGKIFWVGSHAHAPSIYPTPLIIYHNKSPPLTTTINYLDSPTLNYTIILTIITIHHYKLSYSHYRHLLHLTIDMTEFSV